MRPTVTLVTVVAATLLAAAAGPPVAGGTGNDAAKEQIARLLDDWHDAAAMADENRYFDHFAPDAVFLGTDGGERWTVKEFRAYAHPHFARGTGWTCRALDRHVMLSVDGRIAWFDEKLEHARYGELRGTGVLRRDDAEWKLVHYSMTFAVPNDLSGRLVELIRDE